MASRLDNWCSSESSFKFVDKLKSPLCFVLGADEPPPPSSSSSSPPPSPRGSDGGVREEAVNENSRSPRPESPQPKTASPKRPNDSPRDVSPSPQVTPNRRDLSSSSSPKAADAPAPTLPNDTNSSLANSPANAPVQGGNPFPDTPVAATSEGQRLPGVGHGGGNPTILIVSLICGAMFAMLLVGAFVFHRRKQSRTKNAPPVLPSNTHELEDGIFDAVPKPKPGNMDFTIEDFTAAPIGLYDREANKSPPPPSTMPVFEINMEAVDGNKRPLSAIPKHMLINTTAPFSPTLPESGRSTPLTSRDVIFSSPFSPTDTGYHIAEDQVFGAPMYGLRSTSPKTPTTQPTYSPNTAAIAAAVVSAVQGTASAQHSPTFMKNESRMSMDWPSAFDDEPYGSDARIVDLGYGANMAGDDDVEEFPDVPRVDPADPRLKVM